MARSPFPSICSASTPASTRFSTRPSSYRHQLLARPHRAQYGTLPDAGERGASRALRQGNDVLQVTLGFATFVTAAAALIGVRSRWISPMTGCASRACPERASCFSALSIAIVFVDTEARGYHRVPLAGLLGLLTYLPAAHHELLRTGALRNLLRHLLSTDGIGARSTLSSLVLISGALYAGLVGHLYFSSRRAGHGG